VNFNVDPWNVTPLADVAALVDAVEDRFQLVAVSLFDFHDGPKFSSGLQRALPARTIIYRLVDTSATKRQDCWPGRKCDVFVRNADGARSAAVHAAGPRRPTRSAAVQSNQTLLS
jgi:hypothetical protein